MKKLCLNFTSFKRLFAISFFVLIFTLFFHSNSLAVAGINRTINFQGKLVNNPLGTNVNNTNYTVVFTIYDDPDAGQGTALWTETQSVTTADGIFRVNLGSVTPFPANFNFNWDGLYLGVKVNADTEMTPRVTLSAVPYAFNAEKVSGLTVQDENGNASTSGTLRIGNGKTVTISSGLTFSGTDGKSFVFPNLTGATDDIVTEDFAQTLTNKTIGSSGLTFSGATVDITTGTDEALRLDANGTGGLILSDSSITLSGFAGNNAILYAQVTTGALTAATTSTGGQCLVSGNGAGYAPTWGSCSAGGGSNWDVVSGAISPKLATTLDFLIGGTSTASAKFAFTGISDLYNRTQASISGQLILMPNNGYSGRMGIGTSTPTNAIELADGNSIMIRNQSNSVGSGGLSIFTVNGSAGFSLREDFSTGLGGWDIYSGARGWRNAMTISNITGNIGFGSQGTNSELYVTRPLSFGANGSALVIFDQIEDQDIFTASKSGATKFVIDKDGEVGIGNSTPSYPFEITNASGGVFSAFTGAGSNRALQYFLTGSSNTYIGAEGASDTTFNGTLQYASIFGNQNTRALQLASQNYVRQTIDLNGLVGIGTNAPISEFYVTRPLSSGFGATGKALAIFDQIENQDIFTASKSGTTRFVITKDGSIGINMSNPSQKLDITHPDETGYTEIRGTSYGVSGNTNSPFFTGRSARGTKTNPAAVQQGDTLLNIGGQGYSTAFDSNVPALMTFAADETWSASNTIGAYISFSTTRNGNNVVTERLRIGSSGQLGLGTTAASSQLFVTRPLSWLATGKALAIFDQIENQDIFTASAGGTTRFTFSNAGALGITSGYGSLGECLKSGGSATAAVTWGACGAGGGSSNWVLNSTAGTIYPINSTLDLILGGVASSSAKFLFTNMNTGNPTLKIFNSTSTQSLNLYHDGTNGYIESSVGEVVLGNGTGGVIIEDSLSNDTITNNGALKIADKFLVENTENNLTLAVFNNTGTGDLFAASRSGSNRFVITGLGNVGIGTVSPLSSLHVTRPLSFTANGKALAIFDQIENQDIFTASYGGTTKFVVENNGNLKITANQTIDTLTAGSLGIGTANVNALTFGNSTATTMTFNVDTSGNFVFQKEGASFTCSGTDKLTLNGSGQLVCGADQTGAGPGGSSNWTAENGVIRPNNNTLDVLFGGTSSQSAKFAFLNMDSNSGRDPMASFSGNLMLESKPNSSVTQQTSWTRVSQSTPGTIANGDTANIASISAMTVYNGSVYVGTYNVAGNGATGDAEVYRYDGGTTWTKVSQSTPGTIRSGGTADIASVSAMTVFNGQLYIGTTKTNAAEVYRYDGGTTWTPMNVAGTFGAATNQDGVSSLAVYQGRLYAGTREPLLARLIRYDDGVWTPVNGTGGTFVANNTAAVSAVVSMASMNGALYLGLEKAGDADVVKYTGAATFLALNLASATGSYSINGAAVTQFASVKAMVIYNGNLIIGLSKVNGAEVLAVNPQVGETGINTFTRLNYGAGQMTNGGTTNIDEISSMAVYNGLLYVGTTDLNSAEIYRYTNTTERFFKVSGTAGTVGGAGSTGIDGVVKMVQSNGDLYAGTYEAGRAEVYKLTDVNIDRSYALQFHANPSIVGEPNGIDNYASIFYLASASANLGSNAGNSGAFIFSHGIQTRNGSYDVAEDYPTRDDSLQPGDLVSIDTNEREFVVKSKGLGDTTLIGVYSEKPALRLSQLDNLIDGAKAVPVALAGRVPVKVNTENGVIKSGDYLTASSIPGVAMKATKAGEIIGQAMSDFSGEGIGKVVVYVKSNTYNGTSAEILAGIDVANENYQDQILQKLVSGQEADGVISEINTDRVIAGLEIISPKIYTDELVAKKIRAEQIEGLELFLGKNMQSYSASDSSVLGATNNSFSQAINIDSSGLATVSASLSVQGDNVVEGMLSVFKSITTPNILVTDFASFFGSSVFKGIVRFETNPIFNSDTAGYAVIEKGSDSVEVVFDEEYLYAPIITANIIDNNDFNTQELPIDSTNFVITKISTKGFTIKLSKKSEKDTTFSWIALNVKDAKTQKSKGVSSVINNPESTQSAAFQSLLNQVNNYGVSPPN